MDCVSQVTGCETQSSTRIETAQSPPVRDWATIAKWRSCFHEVAHLLAGVVLLKHDSRAMVFSDGGGVANIGGKGGVPRSDQEAIAVAAGDVAEAMLSEKYPPPDAETLPQIEVRPCLDERGGTCSETANRIKAAMYDDTIMSDEEAIARWCIAGHETSPHRWKFRFDWLKDRAQEFVEDFEQELVSLAGQLFVLGTIALPANPAERH